MPFVLLKIAAPIKRELAKDGKSIDFHCINGRTEAHLFLGSESSFEGPFYGYYDEIVSTLDDVAPWILTTSLLDARPEDWMRKFRENGRPTVNPTAAVAYIQDYADHQSEPFDLVLGFSEGASVAASTIVHQARTHCLNAFKGAIFIGGYPPYDMESHRSLLADEDTTRIRIPTAHIVGSADPSRASSLALYNICDAETSILFDHDKGHIVPTDGRSTMGMAAAIREVRDGMLVARSHGSLVAGMPKL